MRFCLFDDLGAVSPSAKVMLSANADTLVEGEDYIMNVW